MRPPFHAGHALGLGAALILPVALYTKLGVAPLFIGIGVLTLITWAGRRPAWADARGPLLALILALPAWALISALWSITPGESVKTGVSFLGTCIGGAVIILTAVSVTAREREIFISWMVWGGAFGFSLMFIDLFFDGPVYSLLSAFKGAGAEKSGAAALGMNAGGVAAALFAWCWGCALYARYGRGVCAAGLVLAAAAVMQTHAETPIAAFAAGGAAAAVFSVLHRVSARGARIICAGLTATLVILTPVVINATPHIYDILEHFSGYEFPLSVRAFIGSVFHRLAIWQTAVSHMAEAPLTGLGFDTSRALYDSSEQITYWFKGYSGYALLGSTSEPIPLHPHNAVVQIWLELGAMGALIFAALSAFLFRRVAADQNFMFRFFACAAFFSGLAAFSVAFGAWQSWWLGALFMTAAFTAALSAAPEPSPPGDMQKQV